MLKLSEQGILADCDTIPLTSTLFEEMLALKSEISELKLQMLELQLTGGSCDGSSCSGTGLFEPIFNLYRWWMVNIDVKYYVC